MSDISEATHEFRQGEDSCLYSTIRFLLQVTNGIDNKRTRKLVEDKIGKLSKKNLSNGTNENNKFIEKTTDENKFKTLASLCRQIFCVISIRKNGQVASSVNVRYYGEHISSFKQCVYIIYDETHQTCSPLYLINKNNPEESRTIFDRQDNTINILLRNFFKNHLKYDKFVQLGDQINTMIYDVLPRIQNESNDTSNVVLNSEQDTTKQQMTTKGDECLIMSNSTETTTCDTNADSHQLSTIKATISDKTHEFRIGELPGDDQCLFSSAIYSFDRSQTINIKTLRKKVANLIRESTDIDDIRLLYNTGCQTREDYCRKIEEGTIWGSEAERHALGDFYPNILFCIISKITNDENESLFHTDTYVKDISSYQKCIIIVYDAASNNYIPLYLYDKINQEEEKTNFKYNDIVKKLLGEFIQKTFNYHGYINFDNECTGYELDPPSHVEFLAEFGDLFEKIAVNTIKNIWKVSKSKGHKKPVDNCISSETSKHKLELTPKFAQRSVDTDHHCLFSSFCFVLRDLETITVKDLRNNAASLILQSNDISDEVLYAETRKTRKEYCDEIQKTDRWGGEAEIRVIGKFYGVIVRIVNIEEIHSTILSVYVTEFPENEPSFEKCVYLILRNSHYEPLYLPNGNNSNGDITIFNRNDETVENLLCEFIGEKLGYYGDIQFYYEIDGGELEIGSHQKDGSLNEFNLIDKNAKETVSKKRKRSESPFMVDATTGSTPSISCANEVNSQASTSRSIPSGDQVYTHHKEGGVQGGIEQLLQMDMFNTLELSTIQDMEQQQIELNSSILSKNTEVFHNAANYQMEFEKAPIQGFSGQYLSDYEPKNEDKRDGTKSKPRKPSYFADLDNRHYLKLLIPETLLFGDLYRVRVEICTVTATIKDCIYFHPYFKFYIRRGVEKPLTCNLFYICLGYDNEYELEKYAEGIQSMLLYLVVIMVKNDELLKNQPLQPFPSLYSNGDKDETIYNQLDVFKNTFSLNDLRFAVTLWVKNVRDGAYHRRLDLQYISQISTQNHEFTVEKYLKNISRQPSTTTT